MNIWRFERPFSAFCAAVLAGTAFAKIISVVGDASLATKRDFLLDFLTLRQVFAITAVLELIVAGFCLSKRVSSYTKWLSVFWLSTCFVLYRLGPWIVFGQKKQAPCKCLGDFALRANSWLLDDVLLAILASFLIGSLYFFWTAHSVKAVPNNGIEVGRVADVAVEIEN